MTIEIEKPELEALILERMQKGQFASVEDALMQALQSSPLPPAPQRCRIGAPRMLFHRGLILWKRCKCLRTRKSFCSLRGAHAGARRRLLMAWLLDYQCPV